MGAPSLRSRIVIPAAILVTAAYVKGRLDAHPPAEAEQRPPIPVATPGDPIRRGEAEAADALAVAQAQAAAAATPVVERPAPTFTRHAPAPTPHAFRPQVFRRAVERPAAAGPSAPAFEMPVVEWSCFEPEWLAGPRVPATRPLDPAWRAVLTEWIASPGAPAPRVRDAAEAAVLCEWTAPVGPAAAAAELVVGEDGRFSLGGWAAQTGHMAFCGVTFRDRRGAPVEASAIRLVPEATSNVADGGLVVLADPGFAPDAEGFTLLLAAAGPGSFAASGRYEVLSAA